MIQCSESCVHEYDGLCSVKEVTNPSKTPKKNCPYFNDKQKKDEENSESPPSLH